MESFSTHPRRGGHDGNHPPAGRRGTFKNRTWVPPERNGLSSPFQTGNHLGADATRWERGGTWPGGRGRGRGRGRSPKPEFGSSQPLPAAGDVSEVEEGGAEFEAAAAAADAMDGTEPGPGDEPVLDTLEEREQYYQEVSSRLVILSALDPRKRKNTRHNSCALILLAR